MGKCPSVHMPSHHRSLIQFLASPVKSSWSRSWGRTLYIGDPKAVVSPCLRELHTLLGKNRTNVWEAFVLYNSTEKWCFFIYMVYAETVSRSFPYCKGQWTIFSLRAAQCFLGNLPGVIYQWWAGQRLKWAEQQIWNLPLYSRLALNTLLSPPSRQARSMGRVLAFGPQAQGSPSLNYYANFKVVV